MSEALWLLTEWLLRHPGARGSCELENAVRGTSESSWCEVVLRVRLEVPHPRGGEGQRFARHRLWLATDLQAGYFDARHRLGEAATYDVAGILAAADQWLAQQQGGGRTPTRSDEGGGA